MEQNYLMTKHLKWRVKIVNGRIQFKQGIDVAIKIESSLIS